MSVLILRNASEFWLQEGEIRRCIYELLSSKECKKRDIILFVSKFFEIDHEPSETRVRIKTEELIKDMVTKGVIFEKEVEVKHNAWSKPMKAKRYSVIRP